MRVCHHGKVDDGLKFGSFYVNKIPGGGLPKMWSSMLQQNLVWNGESKVEKWCGIVWTQNGGKICMT